MFVGGAVTAPGPVAMDGPIITLDEAIRRAGGTAYAKTTQGNDNRLFVTFSRGSTDYYVAAPLLKVPAVGLISLTQGERVNVVDWSVTPLISGYRSEPPLDVTKPEGFVDWAVIRRRYKLDAATDEHVIKVRYSELEQVKEVKPAARTIRIEQKIIPFVRTVVTQTADRGTGAIIVLRRQVGDRAIEVYMGHSLQDQSLPYHKFIAFDGDEIAVEDPKRLPIVLASLVAISLLPTTTKVAPEPVAVPSHCQLPRPAAGQRPGRLPLLAPSR